MIVVIGCSLISLICGTGIGLILATGRTKPPPALPEPPKPICSCKHPRSAHALTEEGKPRGACTTQIDIHPSQAKYIKMGPCPCVQYEGPIPTLEFYDQEL